MLERGDEKEEDSGFGRSVNMDWYQVVWYHR